MPSDAIDRPESLKVLAEALGRLLSARADEADSIIDSLPKNLHGDALDVVSNVMHFVADFDIRDKDPEYRQMQETHMRNLIEALRQGEPKQRLMRFSFLTRVHSSDFGAVERHMLAIAGEQLEQSRALLDAHSVRFEAPQLEVISSDPKKYTSEIRIYFWRKDELIDALEFFVFRDGRQDVQADDLAIWLSRHLEEIAEAGEVEGSQ